MCVCVKKVCVDYAFPAWPEGFAVVGVAGVDDDDGEGEEDDRWAWSESARAMSS